MANAGDNSGNEQSGKTLKTGWLTKQGNTKQSIVNLYTTMYTSLLSQYPYIQYSVDYSLAID